MSERYRVIEDALSARKVSEAETLLAVVLKELPASAELLILQGRLHHLKGDGNSALVCIRTALTLSPNNVKGVLALAHLFIDAGKLSQARHLLGQVIDRDRENDRAQYLMGCLCMREDNLKLAMGRFSQALKLSPENVLYAESLAHAMLLSGEFYASYKLCCKFSRIQSDALRSIAGDSLFFMERYSEAISFYNEIEDKELRSKAQVKIARCYVQEGDFEKAIEIVESADSCLAADRNEMLGVLANIHVFRGDKDKAIELFREILSKDPSDANSWFSLSEIDPGLINDDDIEQVVKLLDSNNETQVRYSAFVMARFSEKHKKWADELKYLSVGNRLAAKRFPYHSERVDEVLDSLKSRFDSEIVCSSLPENDSFSPIFIMGLPRSGTTLTEQVISSHSDVFATGESLGLSLAMRRVGLDRILDRDDDSWVAEVGGTYQSFQIEQCPEARFFTDKNISLYKFVGVLKMVFPGAVFVALDRHPLDIMVGAWKRHFGVGNHFSYSIPGLAHAVRVYQDYLDHWTNVCGVNILRLSYESLVRAPDEWIPRLAHHCGIDMQESMLSPSLNQRVVLTASATQVREAINTSSVARWRRYGELLEPFVAALRNEGVDVSVVTDDC